MMLVFISESEDFFRDERSDYVDDAINVYFQFNLRQWKIIDEKYSILNVLEVACRG